MHAIRNTTSVCMPFAIPTQYACHSQYRDIMTPATPSYYTPQPLLLSAHHFPLPMQLLLPVANTWRSYRCNSFFQLQTLGAHHFPLQMQLLFGYKHLRSSFYNSFCQSQTATNSYGIPKLFTVRIHSYSYEFVRHTKQNHHITLQNWINYLNKLLLFSGFRWFLSSKLVVKPRWKPLSGRLWFCKSECMRLLYEWDMNSLRLIWLFLLVAVIYVSIHMYIRNVYIYIYTHTHTTWK